MTSTTEQQTAVRYEKDADGIVTLTLDDPNASANTMNEAYRDGMHAAVDRLYDELAADPDSVTGVVVASAKKTFFAGGNLSLMIQAKPEDAPRLFAEIEGMKADLRRLEKLPKPVVAAINGAALGGGYEITLACQHRILVDDPKAEVGLPEASLGLLPGGGGVTRVTRMLGIQSALMDVLLQGTRFKPADALDKGLVHELVATRDALVPAAKQWIRDHRDDEASAYNAWDRPGYRMPGGTPKTPALAAFLPAFPALLRQQTKGADYPAQRAILSATVEGASVDFDTASRIESRYLTKLIVGQNSKNMIQAFFFDLQAINAGKLRPRGFETFRATKVAVLGAGMMGAGIAYSCARAGMQVVLKDVSTEAAERGKAYSESCSTRPSLAGSRRRRRRPNCWPGSPRRATRPTSSAATWSSRRSSRTRSSSTGSSARWRRSSAPTLSSARTRPRCRSPAGAGVDRPADFIGLHFFARSTDAARRDHQGQGDVRGGARQGVRRTSSRSARRRSSSTTSAASTPRACSAPWQRRPDDARRGRAPAVARAGRHAVRLPRRAAAAHRRAEHGR